MPTSSVPPQDTLPHDRAALRRRLLAHRQAWLSTPAGQAADAALGQQIRAVLTQLEPQCLGLYWPLECEFNAAAALRGLTVHDDLDLADGGEDGSDEEALILATAHRHVLPWALPFAYKSPRRMEFRRWDGAAPNVQDECGIASSRGAAVVPDVVLVPCVGFTREGYRLGYGGGYFDRWLAAHPGVTSLGVAWSISETSFAVEAHDCPLTLLITEHEVISS
ncbi:5-formyltetrahydrofolate cyclo-ligase [Roseateles koreensis]|uniref:5-formyltetrahydrofolate cyclo-ligase n=1 Tax=Roseateles koreensis TaxID=2987526 RepID=A0ABT5KP25_9BURK|nr:5-formyltetrahydrofolate cyclo-ligase [Roseateles koreensis]MDC8784617.1 5-formyltetrahydrofolate cyclo-ligase [Roseateles koreensis]